MHTLVARLIAAGELQGLRLDHIDGLRDPAQYARRLRQLTAKMRGKARRRGPFYVVVEKILGHGESMPKFPGVAGTTGYEWLNVISRVLLDGKGLDRLERSWRTFTGEQRSFARILDGAKLRVIDSMLASEFTVLCGALARIAAGHFSTRDFTIDRLRAALQLYVLEFPVYRTYVTAAGAAMDDRERIDASIARARARWQGPDPQIFDFLRDAISIDLAANPGYSAPRVRNFALKLQQFTGPLMAKAMEDTAFYRYHRLLALNEVGGEPAAPALSLDDFHAQQRQRAEIAPSGLSATATHDTKRGEDARMRILALAELAQEWDAAVQSWRELNAPLVQQADGKRSPSIGHEYMLYQALIGAWPGAVERDFIERMQAYALKAAREAKQETSWNSPDAAYEEALQGFVGNLLDATVSARFLESFSAFAARTTLLGALNGLSQLALKTLTPGVPDFYQGTEFWDLSLVDPDNRRAVDFAMRRRELAGDARDWPQLAANWPDGRIKLALTRRLLRLRHDFDGVFQHGAYEPVPVTGPHAEHVIAFARTRKHQRLVVAIGRHFCPLTDAGRQWPSQWDGIIAPDSKETYETLIGGETGRRTGALSLADLFRDLPVCMLRSI
jgi:(1->4)-alpha-D-glucan 1-alpha-D-glucosylmutase